MSREERIESLERELDNAQYHLAEAEMGYDQTHDEDAADAIRFWFGDVNRINDQLDALDEKR